MCKIEKYKILTIVFIFALFVVDCQQQEQIQVVQTYNEPIDPSPKSASDWSLESEGLNASITSTNIRFEKKSIPKVNQNSTWYGEAWRGERISSQLVLWSKDPITNVAVKMSSFISEGGEKLASDISQVRFVKYVITDEFANGCGYRKPEDFDASLAADVLDFVSTYSIKSKETRPVWISINVPSDAIPGIYTSTLTIGVEGQKAIEFKYSLEVIDRTLPLASDWKFHLDLWQNPFAVARFHNVELWSNEHWTLLKPLMKSLAEAGQKVITVSLNKRPWGGQTYDQFETMIDWKKKIDGNWEYDFTIFDNWVQFMMDLGVKNQINCYSMVPWGNEFYYFDEKENKEVKTKALPGTKEYEELWVPFLSQFKVHLKEKGWNNIIRMAIDERGPLEMKAMINLLDNYAPEFGISLADNHKSYKLYPNKLKDLSVAFGATIDKRDQKFRKKKGYISTNYVCCTDEFPNVFTFSPPAEGVFIGWYSIAANFDGFLRWAYNSWVEKPLQDSRFRAWPAGDTYLIYPNNRSSIRFESLREGIQDAEKIRILREEFLRENKTEELQSLNNLVDEFNVVTKPNDLEGLLREAKKKLNEYAKK